jgi:hypothetical protein
MRHRHIDLPAHRWSVAAVESAWERGSDADVLGLARDLARDPRGDAAQAVRVAAAHCDAYGWPALFTLFLEDLMKRDDYWEKWQSLLASAARMQEIVSGCVLVGGSAVAIHLRHRYSADADHIVSGLSGRFAEVVDFLEGRDDWHTARLRPPKLVLGNFEGVETGLRQLIRRTPLETEAVDVDGLSIVVPTIPEMLRVKGWMIVCRNATRDFIDLAALARHMGPQAAADTLSGLDRYYDDAYRGTEVSPAVQLARQLAQPAPHDLERTPPSAYKGIVPPLNDWDEVAGICKEMGRGLFMELGEGRATAPEGPK